MSLLIAWVAFPAVLAVLSLGCGLALERASGVKLAGSLLIPAGLAVIVVAGQLATATDATAELAVPLVIVLAASGLALSPPWKQRARFDGWAFAAAAAVFAVYAAPVVISGHATWTGWIKLDDDAAWFAIVDRIMDHGRNLSGLAPSSYQMSVRSTLADGYPIGAFIPLGVGARILHYDPAWLLQPWMSFGAATLALVFHRLLVPVVPGRALRAFCVFVAAQPALLFGYVLWGGVKEVAAAWVLALVAALVPYVSRNPIPRSVLPLGVAVAATLAIVSLGGGIWIVPAIAGVFFAVARRRGLGATLRLSGGLAAFALILALPALAVGHNFVRAVASPGHLLTSHTDIGNLYRAISPAHIIGVWPAGDFRASPRAAGTLAGVLMITAALASIVGVAVAVKRRAWALALYACATATIGLAVAATTGPWIAAKSLAIASPAVLVLAMTAAAEAYRRGRRMEGTVVAAAIAVGVLWSNALAYHDVNLAPRDQLTELARIGDLVAGQGPTLMTEYNPNAARHFLRAADADSVSELRARLTPLRTGIAVPKLNSADTDELQLDGLLAYRTLVLRRSPVASRPPSMYRLVWTGRTYEVWQRGVRVTRPLAHLPLGGPLWAAARPRCSDVRRLSVLAGATGRLAAVPRPHLAVVNLGVVRRPAGWGFDRGNGSVVIPLTTGALATSVVLPASGRFDVWLGGSVRGRLTASVDGRRVATLRHVLNNRGGYMGLGEMSLAAGAHRVTLAYHAGGLRPGTGDGGAGPFPIGPLMLNPAGERRAVTYTPAAEWRSLCNRDLDWIEALPAD